MIGEEGKVRTGEKLICEGKRTAYYILFMLCVCTDMLQPKLLYRLICYNHFQFRIGVQLLYEMIEHNDRLSNGQNDPVYKNEFFQSCYSILIRSLSTAQIDRGQVTSVIIGIQLMMKGSIFLVAYEFQPSRQEN